MRFWRPCGATPSDHTATKKSCWVVRAFSGSLQRKKDRISKRYGIERTLGIFSESGFVRLIGRSVQLRGHKPQEQQERPSLFRLQSVRKIYVRLIVSNAQRAHTPRPQSLPQTSTQLFRPHTEPHSSFRSSSAPCTTATTDRAGSSGREQQQIRPPHRKGERIYSRRRSQTLL